MSTITLTGTQVTYRVLGDIRAWVILSFLIRLVGITNPPLETSHHWRQTTVNMVARNFAEGGIDLLHPRMDTAGALTGITGMEFPLLNALIAVCINLFGFAHWYGRLIVLVVSLLGVKSFHQLVERHCDERTAFHAGMLLLFSLWFMYGRKIMPDVFALSLVLIGIERTDKALRVDRWWPLAALGATLVMAGTLSKITAGCLLAVWPVLVWRSPGPHSERMIATGLLGLACVPCYWWYFEWVPYLVKEYGYWHFFMGKPMSEGALELLAHSGRTFDNFYFDAMRYSGFAVFCYGLFLAVRSRKGQLLILFLLASSAFLVVMLRSGDTFWIHAYYVLPYIPVMALFGGFGLGQLPKPAWANVLLALVIVEGLAAQFNDFHIDPDLAPLLELSSDLDSTNSSGLIAVNSASVPTPMYFAHRKGWTLSNSELQKDGVLDSLASLGCERVVVMKHTFEGDLELPWLVLLERDDHRIYCAP